MPGIQVTVLPSVTELGREIVRALDGHVTVWTCNWPHEMTGPYDLIYPAHDDVIYELRGNPKLVSSPSGTIEICRLKSWTYEVLGDVVRVPKGGYPKKRAFPCFVKPDRGQGSKFARMVGNEAELKQAITEAMTLNGDAVVSEYLPGDEYTVDCFSDRDYGLMWMQPRKRIETERGISTVTETVSDDGEFRAFAEAIESRLMFRGAWFFQVKRDSYGKLCLLEVAPRIAGGSSLARLTGVNLPLMSVKEAMRERVIILSRSGMRMERVQGLPVLA